MVIHEVYKVIAGPGTGIRVAKVIAKSKLDKKKKIK